MTNNPFKPAPIVTDGDTNVTDIYVNMGIALHTYNFAESQLARIFGALVCESTPLDIAFRSMGAIINARSKKAVVDEAAETFFSAHPNGALKGELDAILNLYDDAAARRNDIAHGIVLGHVVDTDPCKPNENLTTAWVLVPGINASNKRPPGPTTVTGDMKYRYNSIELKRLAKEFEKLNARAGDLWIKLRAFVRSSLEEHKKPHAYTIGLGV